MPPVSAQTEESALAKDILRLHLTNDSALEMNVKYPLSHTIHGVGEFACEDQTSVKRDLF